MENLIDMKSETNSLRKIKEKYKKGVIDNINERLLEIREIREKNGGITELELDNERRKFDNTQFQNCYDDSIGSNARWGIVGRKNFFGLEAELYPTDVKRSKDSKYFLRAMSGRFQMQKFDRSIFTTRVNISDIRERSEDEQFKELEEFYNMTNRDVFEKYGVLAYDENTRNLVASCVVLDSLLKDKYSEIKDVFCYTPDGYGIKIKLEDGVEIQVNTRNPNSNTYGKKGITIKKDGKEARVEFDAISIGEKHDVLENIDDLEVENVEYTGDAQLIAQLQQALKEQFKSEREKDGDKTQQASELDSLQEEHEKTGAEKIIEFMRQNKLEPHDLSLALSMVLARTTDITNAEQHIVEGVNPEIQATKEEISL